MENRVISMRNFTALKSELFNDEGCKTVTSKEQMNTEQLIEKCYDRFEQIVCLDPLLPELNRHNHFKYLETSLQHLTTQYECLDSSRPWLVYWILNSVHLLNYKLRDEVLDSVVDFLIKCRSPIGGFGGGPGQQPHLAPTYAAVNSLCIIGTDRALEAIDSKSLVNFLRAVRESSGAFRMHIDGELDVRGAYCAISSAKLACVAENEFDELFKDTAKWIVKCQTYEGGFGGAPNLEAHGGYSFCGAAALALLGTTEGCDLNALMRWTVNRQMRYEGGFQGRTNKLVDGCYSFWQGALIPVIQALLSLSDPSIKKIINRPLFCNEALQEYLLICCQRPHGGLIDKPNKPADLYHTCYGLSGLSIAQHCEFSLQPRIIGHPNNELLPTHPLHNVPPKAVMHAISYFNNDNFDESSQIDDIWENESTKGD